MKAAARAIIVLLFLSAFFALPALADQRVSFASIPCEYAGCSALSWTVELKINRISLPNFPYGGPSYVNVSSETETDYLSHYTYTCGINVTTFPVDGSVHAFTLTLPNQDSGGHPISDDFADGYGQCEFLFTWSLSGPGSGGYSPPNGYQYSLFGAGTVPENTQLDVYVANFTAGSGAGRCPSAPVGSTCNLGSYDVIEQDEINSVSVGSGSANMNMTCGVDQVQTTSTNFYGLQSFCDVDTYTVSAQSVFVGNFNATLNLLPLTNFYQEPVTGMLVSDNATLSQPPGWYGTFLSWTAPGPSPFQVYVVSGFTPVALYDNGQQVSYTYSHQIMGFTADSPIAIQFEAPGTNPNPSPPCCGGGVAPTSPGVIFHGVSTTYLTTTYSTTTNSGKVSTHSSATSVIMVHPSSSTWGIWLIIVTVIVAGLSVSVAAVYAKEHSHRKHR